MKAVLYRRSATENPTWLNDQEADCRRYASDHGLTITDTFLDIGRTGDGLDAMLHAAEQDDVHAVIVTDLARLGAKLTDHIATVQRLHDAGVDIHVTKESATSNTQDAHLFAVMQAYAGADDQLDSPLRAADPDD